MISHPTQTRLLAEIARQAIEQETLTIAAMAEALGLDDSNTSRTLKRMAQDGWITRDPLALTDAGRAVLAAAPPVLIPHSQIDPSPRNPRQMNLADGSPQLEELRQLAESIADKGQLQPILVRPVKNGVYEIVGGERRWRAMVLLIMEDRLPEDHPVAASIRPLSDEDAMVLALAENMARRDMNPMDEAEGLFSVYGPRVDAAGEGERRSAQAETVERLARATGQSVRYIQARIRLARDLTESVRALVRSGELGLGFAHEVAAFDQADQWAIAELIRMNAEGWQTVEQVRARRKGAADSDPPPNAAPEAAKPEAPMPAESMPTEAIRTAEALALAEAEGVQPMETYIPAGAANENGVYAPTVTYEIFKSKSPWGHAELRLAKCRDGQYRFSIDYQDTTGGGSGPISERMGVGFEEVRQVHYAGLNALAREARKTLQTEPDNRSARMALKAIERTANAWQIDLDGFEDLASDDSSARHASKSTGGNPAPAPAATNTGTPAPAPEGWPRDADASTLTDRALIHALAHAISGGAMRITIDADPLAQPVAAELMARIAGVPEYDGITVKAGGNRAIVSGRR